MYRLSKEFSFAMGHRLSCHQGLCKNFHGHNYTVIVGVKCEFLNANGMVIDFSDLKAAVMSYIDQMDHALMLNNTDEGFIKSVKKTFPDMKIIETPYDPTAENMARDIFLNISKVLNTDGGVEVDYVTVYETDTSQATYSKD